VLYRDMIWQYWRRLWGVVVLQMLVDLVAALFVTSAIGLLAAGLIALAGHSLGVTLRNVRHASAVLGCVYIFSIWARTLHRHWIISGQVAANEPTHEPQASESANAQPSTSSAT
jgi:hypothetical protein